ncbi:conserved repeat domain-containing protein [Halogranum gelatinilyticum]|uniref:Conserved repeat domain-containing protein n=1 Tax=Halogranum gelatinilyticum TaxID=660521 RepID=A0A1G9Q9I1_9EURY|nr:DUF58 domain-containing protein [Halogranum gelatinilyticum]SDM07724.1 conserved repeat domain-containing protein [Halogranum gelatinilyticum]
MSESATNSKEDSVGRDSADGGDTVVADDSHQPVESRRAFDTNRWVGATAVAFLPVGVAILFGRRPGLLLAAVVGIAYVAYARSGEAPVPDLRVERELSDDTPDGDDEVRVTVTVTNTGESTLPDLRLVDGVPPALAVVDGSPRHGAALRPGKRASFGYTVTAVRGEHEWEPMQAITRNASGSRERVSAVDAATTMRCLPRLDSAADIPLRGLTTQYTGRIATNVGGSGLEFHSTREYKHGDPLNRVDWKRLARSGELATLEFREERAATVVALVDARQEAYLAGDQGEENAVERGVDAASQVVSSLLDSGDRVGIAALSAEECWLAPGVGNDHRARARQLLATHPALAATPGDGKFFPSIRLRRLLRRLPTDAQVVLFSPLADDYPVSVARRLDATGHLVTVVSPDPTGEETTGHRLATAERRNRASRLRQAGIRVVDWGDEPLATTLTTATRRWSA